MGNRESTTGGRPTSQPGRGDQCHHCDAVVPRFDDLAHDRRARITGLISGGRSMMAMAELRDATGCSPAEAKVWVEHRGRPQPREYGTAACPYCGGALRTSLARQCPHCLQQWHDNPDLGGNAG